MDLSDYVRREKQKMMLLEQIEVLGLRAQAQVIDNKDLDKILHVLTTLGKALRELSEEERAGHLLAYVVGLLVRLVVDYGAELKDL